jgi:hypothetical protein
MASALVEDDLCLDSIATHKELCVFCWGEEGEDMFQSCEVLGDENLFGCVSDDLIGGHWRQKERKNQDFQEWERKIETLKSEVLEGFL